MPYKIMQSRHYKRGSKFNTTKAHYGKRLSTHKPTLELIMAILNHLLRLDVTINDMLIMCLDFQTGRTPHRCPAALSGPLAAAMIPLAKGAIPIHEAKFSVTFWEALYEAVRSTERPACPSRLDSYFACNDLAALRRYRDSHWGSRMADKAVCQIDIVGCHVRFEADTVILDQVTEVLTYEAAKKEILRYWDQEMSDTPVIELLLQGTVVLKDLARLD
jgi:hypothetical protein